MRYTTLLAASLIAANTQAHMIMSYPPALHGPTNPYTKNRDSDLSANLQMAQLPCKGYHSAMKDPTGEGTPTAIWKQGGAYNVTITAGAEHGGGSCQLGLSYDQGKTWTAIHTYEGGCGAGSFDFNIPSDAPTSKGAIFSWVWYNKIGNREIYMNCAAVTIDPGTAGSPAVPFNKRPDMAFFNLANPRSVCETPQTTDAVFPNPGPDVTKSLTAADTSGQVTAACIEANRKALGFGLTADMALTGASSNSQGTGDGHGSNTPSSSSSGSNISPSSTLTTSSTSPYATSLANDACSGATVTVTRYIESSSPSASPSSNTQSVAAEPYISASPTSPIPSPIPSTSSSSSSSGTGGITTDGACGSSASGKTCKGSQVFGACCSKFGYCGIQDAHCGSGCMEAFGVCGEAGKTANSGVHRRVRGAGGMGMGKPVVAWNM